MIKFENTEVVGWNAAIRGMRNPLNSWDKSDSDYRKVLSKKCDVCMENTTNHNIGMCDNCWINDIECSKFLIGPNDYDLMKRLRNAGTDHRKFMRMLTVYVDICAPLYWWKEFDTYKIGTVVNSCSTMHTIHKKEFTLEDFSTEHLVHSSIHRLGYLVTWLNLYRYTYLNFEDQEEDIKSEFDYDNKNVWWQMIQLLPTSYNQKRTVMLNYEVLANVYKSRKNHKLDEWSVGFISWIEGLPYSELITGVDE